MKKERRKYPVQDDGATIRPRRKGYRAMCCDCGLVHIFDFRLVPVGRGKTIIFTVRRDNRATAAARRGKRYKGLITPGN